MPAEPLARDGGAGGHDLGGDLVLGQAGRQFLWLKIGRDQHERVVVRLHGGGVHGPE